jgi:Flp pilus assembly protein TadD
MLYWAGKAMARNGMTRDAAALLEALKRRSVPANRRHEGAGLLLAGEIEVAAGRAANALPSLRRGVSLDSSEISLESLAFALERAGATAAADSAYRVVAAAPRFGWEGMLAQRSASRRLTNRVTP